MRIHILLLNWFDEMLGLDTRSLGREFNTGVGSQGLVFSRGFRRERKQPLLVGIVIYLAPVRVVEILFNI